MEDVLVTLSVASDPQISPDGTRVAYVADPYSIDPERPRRAIWIAPTDGSVPARPLTSSAGRDGRPRWSPDGRTLAFLSDRQEKGVDALYLLPLDGGEARLLLERKRGIKDYQWSADGSLLCVRTFDEPDEEEDRRLKERDDAEVYGERWPFARLSLLDVTTGDVTPLPTGDGHVAEFAWSPTVRRSPSCALQLPRSSPTASTSV